MNKKRHSLIAGLVLVLFAFTTLGYADITVSCLDHEFTIKGENAATVNSDFEGTLIITQPSGEILFVESGDQMPELASGSRIEVFEGKITLSSGETSVAMAADPSTGTLEVLSGEVEVTKEDGTVTKLAKGAKYQMNLAGLKDAKAEPTAALESGPGTAVEGLQDPDSTSIQQSPSI